MDPEIRGLLNSIERSMNTANAIKKAAQGAATDVQLAELIDSYTDSLDTLLTTSANLKNEIGDCGIPYELLDMISKGGRPEDFNRDIKDKTEEEISELKAEAEALGNFFDEISKTFSNQENPQ
ncbi:unnamed protein product [Blepharisma stoltei]|uniref:Mediator of RNA polymerase II transcription subunit 10 n=1 Tax=Blepharisma stoltei TaxID=1481888 RepID=A0AAU9IBR6_9CILI|nr:unnamed protein product [Blepharisma stoltei]